MPALVKQLSRIPTAEAILGLVTAGGTACTGEPVDPVFFSTEHESRLLRAAGTWPSERVAGLSVTSAPCFRGELCICAQLSFKTRNASPEPFVMMAYLTPDEWETHQTTGATLGQGRYCLFCTRYNAVLVTEACIADGQSLPQSLRSAPFYNSVDEEGGYKKEYCMMPSGACFSGLTAPLALLRYDLMVAFKEESTGRWCVDQSAMVWEKKDAVSEQGVPDKQAVRTSGMPFLS